MRTPTWTVLTLLALAGCTEDPVVDDTGDTANLPPPDCDFDAYAPGEPIWVRAVVGEDTNLGRGVAALADGSALVAGYHVTPSTFGVGAQAEEELERDGEADDGAHVVRFDCNGELGWVRSVAGSGMQWPTTIAALPEGGAVAAGSLESGGVFGGEQVAALGPWAGYLAWYATDGTLLHLAQAGGPQASVDFEQIGVLSDGSILVVGGFGGAAAGEATFGGGEEHETVLAASAQGDGFAARYAADGELIWARKLGEGGGEDVLTGLAVLAGGTAVVAGTFFDDLVVDEGLSTEVRLGSEGSNEIVLAGIDPDDGGVLWAKRIGAESSDYTNHGVDAFSDGSFALAGSFASTVVFGEGEESETTLTADGFADVFVARYEADGSLRWVRTAGSAGDEWLNAVAVAPDGSVAVTGACTDAMFFDSSTELRCDGGHDAWIASWDADGVFRWAEVLTGDGDNVGVDIAAAGEVGWAVTGHYRGAAKLGETALDVRGAEEAFTALLAH